MPLSMLRTRSILNSNRDCGNYYEVFNRIDWRLKTFIGFLQYRGSRNLVGIAIQLSDSEEEEFFVGYPMLISPEKFDFGIERFGCGI